MAILGIDPSIRCTGLAVIEGNKVLWARSVRDKKKEWGWQEARVYVNDALIGMTHEIPEWPEYVAIEKPFMNFEHANAGTFFAAGLFIGALISQEKFHHRWEWVGTQAVRSALGIKNADVKGLKANDKKNLRVQRVWSLFNYKCEGSSQEDRWAIADAIGVAHALQLRGPEDR